MIDRYPEHNWKIVNRKNGGLSAARNSGIIEAQGDFCGLLTVMTILRLMH